MRLSININMDNAAFEDLHDEVSRMLYELTASIDEDTKPGDGGKLRDINGNTVGEWIVK